MFELGVKGGYQRVMALEKTDYPHPHVVPLRPRDGGKVQVDPPVFTWKGKSRKGRFSLRVCVDAEMGKTVLAASGLLDPIYLPESALGPGTYYWQWTQGKHSSEIHTFRIAKKAVVLEVPPAARWIDDFSGRHPRFLIEKPEESSKRADLPAISEENRSHLMRYADEVVRQRHHLKEPPPLPDRVENYAGFRESFYKTMWTSRKFASGAQLLGLAYLCTGNRDYGKAAARRLTSLSKWDPHGSTSLGANDEPHMSILWYGPIAADWVWDCFTPRQRAQVIDQFRARAADTFRHMHDLGQYGIERFDSHAGREIVFLANLLLLFHDFIPEAETWLGWLRPVLCGVWPIWAEDDGAWAEGLSYGLAYVNIMTLFASALKRRTGVDLYRKPFWKNHARWRQHFHPPYAEWIGFGDHTERWPQTWENTADLLELIARETGSREWDDSIEALREEAKEMPPTPKERALVPISPILILCPDNRGPVRPPAVDPGVEPSSRCLHTFPDIGWAAFRTDPVDRSEDLALFFRSSPYGSVSHSHANNNDFILHVGGHVMAMPSGYYAGYASGHHGHWVWHTKSHNCVTLSDAPQLLRSPESRGELLSPFEDDQLASITGNADLSYSLRAKTYRRHIVYLKEAKVFLLLDEFQAKPGITSSFQWNLHSWSRFQVSRQGREFLLRRKGRSLTGKILFDSDGFATRSDGWDPPFQEGIQDTSQWRPQFQFRYTPTAYFDHLVFGVLLIPQWPNHDPPSIAIESMDMETCVYLDTTEIVLPRPGSRVRKKQLAMITAGGKTYRITRSGLRA